MSVKAGFGEQLKEVHLASSLVFYGSDLELSFYAAKKLAKDIGISDFDTVEIEPEITDKNSKGEIKIAAVRELIRQINLTPSHGVGRLAIIKQADKLSRDSANTLLKTLEEPPKSALLILLSSDLKQIPTVISRCRIIRFADKADSTDIEEAKIFTSTGGKLKDQFAKIERLSQSKNIEACVESLLIILEKELRENGERQTVSKAKTVFEAKKNLQITTNKRLVLENLLLKFDIINSHN